MAKTVTMSDLARALGVSKNTVSLALLNANPNRDAFRSHPTIPVYVSGCRKRALELGYALDEFWLHDPKISPEQLLRVLISPGIRGLLIVGLMKQNRLPEGFDELWKTLPAVVTGVRTQSPALHFASTDHHLLMLQAVQQALALGYQRPALALDDTIDRLVEGRFSSGFFRAQQDLPLKQRTLPLLWNGPPEKEEMLAFQNFREPL